MGDTQIDPSELREKMLGYKATIRTALCQPTIEEWRGWWRHKDARLAGNDAFQVWLDVLHREAPLYALDNLIALVDP